MFQLLQSLTPRFNFFRTRFTTRQSQTSKNSKICTRHSAANRASSTSSQRISRMQNCSLECEAQLPSLFSNQWCRNRISSWSKVTWLDTSTLTSSAFRAYQSMRHTSVAPHSSLTPRHSATRPIEAHTRAIVTPRVNIVPAKPIIKIIEVWSVGAKTSMLRTLRAILSTLIRWLTIRAIVRRGEPKCPLRQQLEAECQVEARQPCNK